MGLIIGMNPFQPREIEVAHNYNNIIGLCGIEQEVNCINGKLVGSDWLGRANVTAKNKKAVFGEVNLDTYEFEFCGDGDI